MTNTNQIVDTLKSAGFYFAAGAVAKQAGWPANSFGCHFGMRSELDWAKAEFAKGYETAPRL